MVEAGRRLYHVGVHMSYIPFARKYRPTSFADVVGHDIVVKILETALQNDRLPHAIVFSGTRGVGKTTLARILAKMLRCENKSNCGECAACISAHNDMDVIEMDAASHTSVEDIRQILESCRYAPVHGKYKIFILDEVHMLSKSAFNAMLKTLEEPPAHVKFFFATTEVEKIPETVLSRCLRFDLKRMDVLTLKQYISSVCLKENLRVAERALDMLVYAADGSVRDCLSMLDQASHINNGVIEEDDIRMMLGYSNDSYIIDLLEHVIKGDASKAIALLRNILASEVSAKCVLQSMMDQIHYLTCVKVNAKPQVAIVDDTSLNVLAQKISISSLTRMWQMMVCGSETLVDDVHLEMLLIRLCYASRFPDLEQILRSSGETGARISSSENFGDGVVISDATVSSQIETGADAQQVSTTNSTEEILSLFPGASIRQG